MKSSFDAILQKKNLDKIVPSNKCNCAIFLIIKKIFLFENNKSYVGDLLSKINKYP
jgi:hypothetical protein